MVLPSLPLHLSCPRALRRQIALLRECLRRDVGFFSPGGAYDSVWDSVKPIAGNTSSIISSTRGRWVCLHAEWLVQQQ